MSTVAFPPDDYRSLPIADRIELVERIWDSIVEDQSHCELTEEQKAELDRRLVEHAAAPDRGASWQDVKARLLSE